MVSETESEITLDQAIASWLPMIDAELHGVPIPDRCMRACFLFMKSAVIEVNGDDKAAFFAKPWFKAVYQTILAWYRKRYGEALKRSPAHIVGACEFLGTIFELQIPRTLSEVETENETAWLIFPNGVWDGESVSSWIVRPPNLHSLDADECQVFLQQVEIVGCQLRNTCVNLMETDDDDITDGLVKMVPSHLAIAASHLIERPAHNLSLACWEAHQAVEKILKALMRQQFGNHLPSHSLKVLRDRLVKSELSLPDDAILSRVPDGKILLSIRAGEAQTNIEQAYDIYRACLEMTDLCARGIKRKYDFHNFRLLLRKPDCI